MTSVEKRRSGRKSGRHRKHSDGGYSDTSSGGSYLDDTDREVSNLTDRAFRSLCIGDEAVYNDSDLCSSPCIQRDRQLAFSQSGQDRDREDREREELKRAAHESFSLRMQQYGQDWIHGGMYGAEIQRDPQWEVYGERTQGRVSATFQQHFVETSQQEDSLREEQMSFFSNGATELSSQQRRSRSRVSSLIRAFNSEGQRDGAGMDGKLREWNDETSWDKSALMSIQRELSEFSSSYQQNFNSANFPSTGPFSPRDTNYYSSEVAAMSHMNSASSFMRSSHSKHSMSAQVNCNSNFFIHSEFSPFKVWRDQNRFPFRQGEVSGFMHWSEFPKWYETPMYRELSLEAQQQGPYRFEGRGIRHPRNNMAPVVPPTLPRSTSTSTILQKASAVEKRCESELTGHFPQRKRTQSLGANRLQAQRPSTASPTSEISRRVQDTISSVKALQQKIKMMTEQNIATGMTVNQGVLCSNDNLIPFGNSGKTVVPEVLSNNTSTTPFNISQLLTPVVHPHQEVETSEVGQYAGSPQPVEHAPVRAESRGATPDVRMSSYKSRAPSLLFNLKDNRKRVKSTYSPPKFKGLEAQKQPSAQEPRDTVIDIPDFPDIDIYPQVDESSRTNETSHQYVHQYHPPGLALTAPNSQPVYAGQYSEYTSSDYQTAQMQSEMIHHSGFTGFIPENYASNQLANGQNPYEDLSSFTPYKQGMIDNAETLGGEVYGLKPSYSATETQRINTNNNHPREYLISKANAEQHFNETVGREFTNMDRYQQLRENKHDYSNVSSQDGWRQTNSQEPESLSLNLVSPWKQEITALLEKDQHAQAYQTAAAIKDELSSSRDKYRIENQQSINKELEKIELRESFSVGTSSHKKTGLVNPNVSNQLPPNAPFSHDTKNPAYYGQQLLGAFKDNKNVPQNYNEENNAMNNTYRSQNNNTYSDQEYINHHTYSNRDMLTQETGQRKQCTPIPKVYKKQSFQPTEAKPQFEQNMQRNSNPDNTCPPTTMANEVTLKQVDEVKAEQAVAEHIKAQHAQAELAKAQHWAQVEQPKAESAQLILAGQTGSEKASADEAKAEVTTLERVNQTKAEHIKEEKKQEEQAEQNKEKQIECGRGVQTKAEQKVTEENKNIKEELGAKHLKEEQGEEVKAAAERLKEEHIKNELAKTKQAQTEQARGERIKADKSEEEQVREDKAERKQMEAEEIQKEMVKVEQIKAEQAEAEHRKAELAKLEQRQEQQASAQEEIMMAGAGKVKANNSQVEDAKLLKAEENPIDVVKVNAEQATIQKNKERAAELVRFEQTKSELAKAELIKTKGMQERLAKPEAKLTVLQQVKSEPNKVEQVKTELARAKAELTKTENVEERSAIPAAKLTVTQQVRSEPNKVDQVKTELAKARAELTKTENMVERSAKPAAKLRVTQSAKTEPDKVEQVKTELAKAKAELAKIKEKMRGEQKVKNIGFTKEYGIKTDVPIKVNNKNEEHKDKDQVSQILEQREDSGVVTRQYSEQANKVVNEYERLREKYGFTDTTSPDTNKSAENVSSNHAIETPCLSLDKFEITNDKSKDKSAPTATASIKNNEEVGSFKATELTESQYVYSESSKEFKLSSGNCLPISVDKKANPGTVSEKLKDENVEKFENCDRLKHSDHLHQNALDLAKPLNLERKTKLSEHSASQTKDQHHGPPRALSHKERAQTKQEILTSKIKAHAEKEISAIKEKGFAVSKNSAKQMASGQSTNIRQRPPSQEASKKHESTVSSNITPKHQMEPLGIRMEPVKSPPSSATIPLRTVDTSSEVEDISQKVQPKEPMKNNNNVPRPQKEAKQTGSYSMITNDALIEIQKKDNPSGIKSPIQTKEQAPKNKPRKPEANQGESSRKQRDGVENTTVTNINPLNKKGEDLQQAIALVKAEGSKLLMTEAIKSESLHEDPAPSLNLVFGQNKTPEADDSLEITGIMVTVRERKPSIDNEQWNECINSEPEKCSESSGLEINKGNTSLKEVSIVKPKDGVQNTHPTVREDQSKVCMSNHGENMQETTTPESRQNNMHENVTVNVANLQMQSLSMNATRLQEPPSEKGGPSMVIVPAKNKAETQFPLCKQGITARETKDYSNKTPKEDSAESKGKDEVKTHNKETNPHKSPTAHTNENFMVNMVNTPIKYTNDSNRGDAENLIKHDLQQSVREDSSALINPSKSRNIDGKSAPLVEEKRYESEPTKPFNKTSPSYHFTENKNTHVTSEHQYKETEIVESNQVDENVHIGSIAIRIVPAVSEKDKVEMEGKYNVATVPSDVAAGKEHKQVASSSCKEKVNTLTDEDQTKNLTPEMKDSLEDKLEVQCVLSSVGKLSDSLKISNQQSNINPTSENTSVEKENPEKVNKSGKSVDESTIQLSEEDYFQVQGVAERNAEPRNYTSAGDMSDAVSKGTELPGLLPSKAAVSNESRYEGNNDVFVLDESLMKSVKSSSVRVQDENMKMKNCVTEDNPALKHDAPPERQSNKNDKREAGHQRKHHSENQSSSSARERPSSKHQHPTKENTVQEKPEVKPKPKERVSTIPEISAIADYARLKVIVSEDESGTIQEFPPNKKEGFFPLIQTRHSRRPNFNADPQDFSVKEKSLPNKTEVNSKVYKEPKPVVYPITEKEHQRTGMFKLGEKERQEKMLSDAKDNEGVDIGAKHAQHLREGNKWSKQESGGQVAGSDYQKVWQVERGIAEPNNLLSQATTSSSTVNRPRSTPVSQHLKPLQSSDPHDSTSVRKDEETENDLANTGDERKGKIRQEKLESWHVDTKAQREKEVENKQASHTEVDRRAENMRVKHLIEENRASLAEEERRAAQREEERRAREREAIALKIKERREKQREAERRAEEERAVQREEEMRAKQREEEEERRMREMEEKRRIKIEEDRRAKLRKEEERLKENEERRRVKQQEEEKAAQEEQQRIAVQEEQQRRAQEEQQRRAAQQEKQRREQEEQQRRAAQEEKQRRAAQEEEQRRAREEQQRRAAQEERQRKEKEEQQRKAAEEKQRRAAQEEQQRRAEEEQHRRATQEEQRRKEQEEQQRRAAEVKQRRAAQEEWYRRAQEEQQKRVAQEEQQRKEQEEQQKKAAEEKQRIAAQEEQQRIAAQEEQEKRAAQEEQQRRAAEEEQQRRAAREEEVRRAKRMEEKILADIQEKRKRIKQIQEQKIEEQRQEKTDIKQREAKQERRTRHLDESQPELKEEKRVAREQMLVQREDEITVKKPAEEKDKLAFHSEKERAAQMDEQKRAAQKIDSLQYYAITSTESERKPRERQLCSPLPSQQKPSPPGSTEDSQTRSIRPHAPPSPAPSLPRSNTSSPALGVKPSMFRVKDNTIRGSSFKSVKPRFHKNFGEDFRVGPPMDRGSERGEEEQEIIRRSAGTPVYPDTGLNRLAAIKESSTFQPAYSSQDYSAHLPQHRPYSRRSIVLDEDDSRSIISNMSEDVESFATSATDLADIRGLYDYDRPESACSFSSDVSRSLGKPPTVPPKSEKALRRAQRLTTRRIKKELSKAAADSPAQDVSSVPSSSSTEVRSSSSQAVASPHFTSPVSLAHAPTLESSLAPSHTERQSHSPFYASPHATGPVSLQTASPHATAPVSLQTASPHATAPISLPVASPNATGPASHTAAPKTVAHIPSSPTLHHANHPAPVTQYQVESSYPQSYPMTQRKVLQDLGSGQYFVVDVPVPVKTKTFFDPETGKYVQLNVRESGQSTSRHQPQQKYPPSQLQSQIKVKHPKQDAPPSNHFALYQGYHGYPKNYQPPAIHPAPRPRSSAAVTLHQDQQPVRGSHSYGYPATEHGQNADHRYSPEKTPYMDTVNDKDKTYNTIYNTHGSYESFPECDTNSQLAVSSVCENENSAHSQCQPRDIITMSELEDFMEVSDW